MKFELKYILFRYQLVVVTNCQLQLIAIDGIILNNDMD